MDLLSRVYSQLHERYRSMTPGSRLMAGLFAAAVVVALGYVGSQQVARPDADLMHGVLIAPSHLPIMEAAFGKAKLRDYVIRGTSIFVPSGQESTYMQALVAANALPPSLGAAKRAAVDGGSFMDIGSQREQMRMKIAKLEDLASAIRSRPGIEYASVDYDVDRPNGFGPKVATAVVWVKRAGFEELEKTTVLAIRDGVVSAFAGLKPEDVTVSDLNGRTWRGAIGNADENLYRSQKHAAERELKVQIENVLNHIPKVAVEVNVELCREQAVAPKTTGRDAASAAAQRISQPNHSNAGSQQPNVGTVINALLSGTSGEGSNSSPENAGAAVPPPSEKEPMALTVMSARVLVRVPTSYFTSLWQQRNPAVPGLPRKMPDQAAIDRIRIEETANIERCVMPLLPPAKDAASLAGMVTVTPIVDVSSATTTAFDLRREAMNWAMQYWKAIVGVGFALFCLFVVRSMVWTKPAEADECQATAVAEPIVEPTPAKPAKVAPPHWRRHTGATDRSIREELSELVEEDPETAANILRKWIGQVS
jgi:flagellar M-ring protein FliF